MPVRKRFSVLFFVALAIWIVACDRGQAEVQTSTHPVITASSSPGEVYREICTPCHGPSVEAFVDDRDWHFGDDAAAMTVTISQGRAFTGTVMPAFGALLTEKQIGDLVAYIQKGIDKVETYDFGEPAMAGDTFRTKQFSFTLQLVTDAAEVPWGMAFLPSGGLLVTDREGPIILVDAKGKAIELSGIPEHLPRGQGGLLDIELHPQYEDKGWIYVSYSSSKRIRGQRLSSTTVTRYRLKDDVLVDAELVFEAQPYVDTRHHYGSRLEFDEAGYLYISIGDRGHREDFPQDLSVAPGKIHRVKDDGSIPDDNPFIGKKTCIESIYSYGHRNPQGMARHPSTGAIWVNEHGPRGGDEINLIKAGANYGWAEVSYGINYSGSVFTTVTEREDVEAPLHYWVPSIAPCGMCFITSDRYPGWQGHLLISSLKYEYLDLCYLDGETVVSEEMLMKGIGRVRNVKQGPDDFIYVAVEEPGRIYRLVPVE